MQTEWPLYLECFYVKTESVKLLLVFTDGNVVDFKVPGGLLNYKYLKTPKYKHLRLEMAGYKDYVTVTCGQFPFFSIITHILTQVT